MSKEKKLVPRLRFEEFKDSREWNHQTLGDLGTVAMNKRIFKNQTLDKGEVPFYKIGTFGKEPDSYISYELFNKYKSKYSYPKIGDILISASGSIGRTVEYGGEDEYFQDSNIVWLEHSNEISNQFLKQFYKIVKWSGLEGSTIKRLYNKNILNTDVILPNIEEQEKIGNFFKKLDELIQLQESKIIKVKAIKSAYLSEMFPKEGEKYPKRRVEGYTGKWEVVRIGDIFKVTRGNVLAVTKTSKIKSSETPYPVYSSQTKNDGLMGYYHDYLFDNAITWTTDGANAGTVKYRPKKFYSTNVNGVLLSEEGYVNQAVAEALNKEAWKHVSYIGNPKLMNNIMSDIKVSLPKDNKELNKISLLFNQLDRKIKLQKEKLEKLEKIKEAYLDDLFV